MARNFNPTLKTLLESMEYVKLNQPIAMDTIPLCRHAGYKWLWGFKDAGIFTIERSKEDGRSHIVALTSYGKNVYKIIRQLRIASYIECHKCGCFIEKFFRVPNDEWKKVTGDEHDQVICKSCYAKMKKKKILKVVKLIGDDAAARLHENHEF
jgi:DNA-binding MarR family transcriptional regulator